MVDHFTVQLKDTSGTEARRGTLRTLHGDIETPIFMPVGTQATVKGLSPEQIESVGAQIILGNTYHLNLRPTSELVKAMGGLHQFMNWHKPILTDSGGFQVFSLAALRKITSQGIHFQSHIDGKKVFLNPQRVVDIQANLGSDIAMVLDECPPADTTEENAIDAVERTVEWAHEAYHYATDTGFLERGHHLFAIVQGSRFLDLRRECAQRLMELPFPGFAIGGVSVGEPEEEMMPQVAACTAVLPEDRSRYVMGVGTPPQLLKMIALGADMFDCVMPSREARHGVAFTPWGKLNLKNSRFANDNRPLIDGFPNYTCRHFSRAYLRHLIVAKEMLGGTLLTIHNLSFFLELMKEARTHIEAGDYATWHRKWIDRYLAGDADG